MGDEFYEAKVTEGLVTVDTPLGSFPVGTQTVAQVDLSVLSKKLAPKLDNEGDNVFVSSSLSDARPDPAPPTKGPHRYTIYVPHDDKARINVGEAHPIRGETGIALDTLSHIHATAYGGLHATFLSLGKPPTTLGSDVNKNTTGYSMHTAGASAHVALKSVTMTSQVGSMALSSLGPMELTSAGNAVNIKSFGDSTITSDKLVLISAGKEAPLPDSAWAIAGAVVLTAADGVDFLAPVAGTAGSERGEKQGGAAASAVNLFLGDAIENDAAKLRDAWVAKSSEVIDKLLTHLSATITIILGFKKTKKEAEDGKGTWKTKTAWGSYVLSILAEMNAIKGEFSDPNTEGDVRLKATKKVLIDAAGGVGITGAKGVAINGFKGASMSGLTASVKGHKEGAVWGGLGASLKALAGGVTISSDLKGVEVTGKKEVKLASEADKASLTGKLDVQLNSTDAKAFVHGKAGAYVGAGEGGAFGMVVSPDKLEIGTVTAASDFKAVAIEADKPSARFLPNMVTIQHGDDNHLIFTPDGVQLGGKKVHIATGSGEVTVNAGRVNLC